MSFPQYDTPRPLKSEDPLAAEDDTRGCGDEEIRLFIISLTFQEMSNLMDKSGFPGPCGASEEDVFAGGNEGENFPLFGRGIAEGGNCDSARRGQSRSGT
jgi:hypothetical protein